MKQQQKLKKKLQKKQITNKINNQKDGLDSPSFFMIFCKEKP